MSRFQPITEAEAKSNMRTVLPRGTYHFRVIEAEETARKATGKLMFKLTIEAWANDTEKTRVWDYVCTDVMQQKLRHLCCGVGLKEQYMQGDIYAADLLHKSGQVELKIEDDEDFGRRNVVVDYVTSSADPEVKSGHEERVPLPTPAEAKEQAETDSIPF